MFRAVTDHVGRALGCRAELVVGSDFEQFETGEVDAGFMCGLPYVRLARREPSPVELLAAPVLMGTRYGGRPIYYSDVIVHASSPCSTFADLRGRSWAYNDPGSHSGYNVTRYRLLEMGETGGFFGSVIAAGSHQRSIRLVAEGKVDGSAVDSQVLAVELGDHPRLRAALRVIDALGPSPIPPVVASRQLPDPLKVRIRESLLAMGGEPAGRVALASGLVERFVSVEDRDYDPIRQMEATAERAGFVTLS